MTPSSKCSSRKRNFVHNPYIIIFENGWLNCAVWFDFIFEQLLMVFLKLSKSPLLSYIQIMLSFLRSLEYSSVTHKVNQKKKKKKNRISKIFDDFWDFFFFVQTVTVTPTIEFFYIFIDFISFPKNLKKLVIF